MRTIRERIIRTAPLQSTQDECIAKAEFIGKSDSIKNIIKESLTDKAIIFATKAHCGQLRKKCNIPYIFHPLEVTKRVLSYQPETSVSLDELSAACVLHDVLEDTKITHTTLEEEFGQSVVQIVNEVSIFAPDITFKEKFEYFESFFNKSLEAITIKIADRVCNVYDFANEPESAWYASKYALQGFFIFQAYLAFEGDTVNPKIISDIAQMEIIVRRRYNISLITSTKEEVEDVLFNTKDIK
jgi:(p)ppGpp synthase/HD superfamily hydrolase